VKITQIFHIFGHFFTEKNIFSNLQNAIWAIFWAIFFTRASGHPAKEKQSRKCWVCESVGKDLKRTFQLEGHRGYND
jgi:hypothetical protein